MIYPTRLAVLVAALGAPLALVVGAVAPGQWVLAVAWPVAIMALVAVDAWAGRGKAMLDLMAPERIQVGEAGEVRAAIAISNRPSRAELALPSGPLIDFVDGERRTVRLVHGEGMARIAFDTRRRGTVRIDRAWLRWSGPMGLAWHQREMGSAIAFPIIPDLRPIQRHGLTLYRRHAAEGIALPVTRGEGSDFDALVEFAPGMDRRTIDWKRSARGHQLLAKRYHSERNNQIVFVIDAGRQMCEPVAGVPRLDRLVSAMLLTAWLALKLGDRVALNAFDSRPRIASGTVSGGRAFAELERVAEGIEYSGDESNYSFALATLGARLLRRSVVILFTEFTDRISADFLLSGLKRLVEKHVVLIVVLRDEELETLAARRPSDSDDVTRAITAAALIEERQLVIGSLRHLGVHIVEADHDEVSQRLAQAYVDLKRRNIV